MRTEQGFLPGFVTTIPYKSMKFSGFELEINKTNLWWCRHNLASHIAPSCPFLARLFDQPPAQSCQEDISELHSSPALLCRCR